MNAVLAHGARIRYLKIRFKQMNRIMRTNANTSAAIVADLRIIGDFFEKYLLHQLTSFKIRITIVETIFIIIARGKV